MASSTAYASYAYAALLAVGGAMGFAKGSTASLMGGVGGAVVFAAAEHYVAAAPALAGPLSAAQVLAASGLAYVMGSRYSASGKFMPAGLVAALSLSMVLIYGARALAARR